MNPNSYTYVIRCDDGSYYTGSTSNIKRRFKEHIEEKVKYTKSRMPLELVFVKEFSTYKEAKKFEQKIKNWKKRKSIERMFNKPDNVVDKYT